MNFRASYQGNPTWKTIMEIVPGAVTCSKKPWTTTFSVHIDSLHEGTIIGTLQLQPLPGYVLFLDPPEIPVTATIRQPKISVDFRERLRFGPIRPGERYRESKSIRLSSNGATGTGDIRANRSITLPHGITLLAGVKEQDAHLELEVVVEATEELEAPHSLTLEGMINLSGAHYPIEFSDNEIELVVEVAPPPAESEIIGSLFSSINRSTIAAAAGAVAAVLGGIFLFRFIKSRPFSALEGKLVVVNLKDSSYDSSRLITANLNNLGKTLRRDSITIGSAKDAGLTIPHKSVAAYHCELYVKIDKGNKRIVLEPLGKNPVIVNLQKISGPFPLSDRDLIEVGAYTFRFENPHPYRQIVVKYFDGRILKGTPSTWDIDSDGFNLLPRDALPGSSEEIYVSFSDLKAVYFVRDFDGQIGRKIVSPAKQIHGLHMLVKFHDNEKIEGYTAQSYSPASPRFYFFPADQSGNTISMLVERQHLRKVKVIEAEQKSGRAHAAAAVSLDETRHSA
jgi:hypothetical protein